ncbi:MAG: hypothetical protein EAZ91_24710 [Cytophagales bacterium]|nr:MAG: hypothetical protein EAZ91_24710 [Cytophagales bacterium]
MIRNKTQLQKLNTVLSLLTGVNQILAQPSTQTDKMQYERQKQQYLAQLTDLLSAATGPLIITTRRSARAA